MALTTLKSLNAEIKQLEAQKRLVEKRDGEVPKALAVLQRYAKVLTPAQRRQVGKIIGETAEAPSKRTAVTPKGPLKGRKPVRSRRNTGCRPVRRGRGADCLPRSSLPGRSRLRAGLGPRRTQTPSSRRRFGEVRH